MKQTINRHQFIDAFKSWETYANNFSYEGLIALYEYLIDWEQGGENEMELDVVATCCEFSEYDSAIDCINDAGYSYVPEGETKEEKEKDALRWLEDQTQVILVEGDKIIIANF